MAKKDKQPKPEDNFSPDADSMDMSGGADERMNRKSYDMTPSYSPPKKSKTLKWLIIFIIILILILAGMFGWLWWRDRDSSGSMDSGESTSETTSTETETEPEATAEFCGEGLTHYQNTTLGLQYCYPEEWGTVSVADAKLDPSDMGTRQNLSFSDKIEVNLGVASSDWSTSFGRDAVCSDPAGPTLPPFTPFSTTWVTEDFGSGTVEDASRGIEKMDGQYLINEYASTTLAEVVCLTGYAVLDGTPFTHATGSYSTTFNATVPTPADHVADPNILISAAERAQFYNFIKSIEDL